MHPLVYSTPEKLHPLVYSAPENMHPLVYSPPMRGLSAVVNCGPKSCRRW